MTAPASNKLTESSIYSPMISLRRLPEQPAMNTTTPGFMIVFGD